MLLCFICFSLSAMALPTEPVLSQESLDSVSALNPKNELVLTESGGGLSGTQSGGVKQTGISLSGEYHRAMNPVIQLGGLLGYTRTSYESKYGMDVQSGYRVGGLATLNFGSRLPEAFYLRGILSRSFLTQNSRETVQLTDFEVRMGKRFELVERVSFSPYVYLNQTIGQYSSSIEYGFRLLSASVHW